MKPAELCQKQPCLCTNTTWNSSKVTKNLTYSIFWGNNVRVSTCKQMNLKERKMCSSLSSFNSNLSLFYSMCLCTNDKSVSNHPSNLLLSVFSSNTFYKVIKWRSSDANLSGVFRSRTRGGKRYEYWYSNSSGSSFSRSAGHLGCRRKWCR